MNQSHFQGIGDREQVIGILAESEDGSLLPVCCIIGPIKEERLVSVINIVGDLTPSPISSYLFLAPFGRLPVALAEDHVD